MTVPKYSGGKVRPCEERRRGEPGHQEAMRAKDGQKSRVTKMAALYREG